jgi:hypothetical protein
MWEELSSIAAQARREHLLAYIANVCAYGMDISILDKFRPRTINVSGNNRDRIIAILQDELEYISNAQ